MTQGLSTTVTTLLIDSGACSFCGGMSGAGGAMTQGLSTRDFFSLEQGHVQRRLHALVDPVRAVVAPVMDAHATRTLSAALQVWACRHVYQQMHSWVFLASLL